MAQNVTIMGASYPDVPAVDLPKTGGGTARFADPSVTTAVAADVAAGKIFLNAQGEPTEGTGSAGGSGGIVISDEPDSHGGTVRTITAVEISGTKQITANGTGIDVTEYAAVDVAVPTGGGVSAERKDVNFYDYDGTIVESYTTAEFANISALPTNPSHTGLTAQGWNMPSNWTLANAKTYVAANKTAGWGQMYTTASGKTEIDVEFTDANRLSPTMSLAVNGTVSVDWGDGSSATTVTGTSLTTRKNTGAHTYPAVGKYTIKVTAVTGSWGFYGSSSYTLLYKNGTINNNRVYANCVKSVRIGAGCTAIGQYAFYYCASLTSITIPSSVTSIGNYAFQYSCGLTSITIPSSVTSIGDYAFNYCYSLASVTIPSSITSIGSYAFASCYVLTSITIPSSVTSIGDYAFNYCYVLTSITIPSSVTSIGNNAFQFCYGLTSVTIPSSITSIGSSAFASCYVLTGITIPGTVTSIATKAFQNCYGLGSIHFKGSTPPTVAAADAFSNLQTDCKIYVPTGKLTAYTTASNYPSSSTYTYVEE